MISGVERDEAHNRVVHIATLAPDKNKDDVARKDYNVQNFNLGPTSVEQDIEDYEDSSAVILGRLRKEIKTNQELKRKMRILGNAWKI